MVEAYRKALELMWKDTCTVICKEKITDPDTHLTAFRERTLLENQPCKLSFDSFPVANGDPVAAVSQSVKLFLATDVIIPAGCKIVVNRPGIAAELIYASSGKPAVFYTHQEVNLELWEGWA